MEDLKAKLRALDKALERMYREKSDKNDLELLKLSIDPYRAKTLFNDMKELFDT
jgi:hypothetical protein